VTFFIGRLCASVNTGVGRVWTAQGSAMPEMRTPYRLSVTLAVLMLVQLRVGCATDGLSTLDIGDE